MPAAGGKAICVKAAAGGLQAWEYRAECTWSLPPTGVCLAAEGGVRRNFAWPKIRKNRPNLWVSGA